MKKLLLLLAIILSGCQYQITDDYEGLTGEIMVEKLTEDEVVEMLEDGTGLVMFGFPTWPWCQSLMPVLNEKANEHNVEVGYFDIQELNTDKTDTYDLLFDEITEYLESIDYDMSTYDKFYVPTTVTFEDGVVTDFNLGTVEGHGMGSDGIADLTAVQGAMLNKILDRMIEKIS